MLLPLLTAVLVRARDRREPLARALLVPALRPCGAAAGFLIANPYALLDFDAFHAGVAQTSASGERRGARKLGLTQRNGHRLLPVVADLGARLGPRRSPRSAARSACCCATAALRARAAAGAAAVPRSSWALQERYFGRWLLPVLPAR